MTGHMYHALCAEPSRVGDAMTEPFITVRDQDGELVVRRDDLLKYTTQANVIAAALMIRVCALAFRLLSPDEVIHRRKLFWTLGFPGAGLVDCVEMISHAVREGRCLQQPVFDHPDAPFSLNGQLLFGIAYEGKRLHLWPDRGIFDDEFREQVSTWQEADAATPGRDAYLAYKARKVTTLMSLPEETLLHYRWLAAHESLG